MGNKSAENFVPRLFRRLWRSVSPRGSGGLAVALVALILVMTQTSRAQTNGRSVAVYAFDNANYWGVAFATIDRQTDPQACARLCDAEPRCKVASFHDATVGGGWANKCVLRSEVGARHPEQKGVRSWLKAAPQGGGKAVPQPQAAAAAHSRAEKPSSAPRPAPGLPLTTADLRNARAPAVSAVVPAEVVKRYGGSIDDTLRKFPAIKAAIGRTDDGFFVPPGDLPVPNGPASENQVVRLGAREILLMSGCRLEHQCGTTWYVIAYEASSTTAALV